MIAKQRKTGDFSLAGLNPARAIVPESDAQVAAALLACDRAGEALVVFGGATLQGIGNAPARYDVALDMRKLGGVRAYDPRDLTIGVGAGITVAELNAALARNRQFLPLDAPVAARATAGGTLAAGWSGPRRAAYGRPRDLLIGCTVALTDGTLASSGGMVVKNVTGYDMGKLYIGSCGTLGVLVRANFKVLPLPAARRVAIARLDEETRAKAVAHVRALSAEPVAALLLDGYADATPGSAGETRLFALFEGSDSAVEQATRDFRSALGAAGVAETRLHDADAAARAFELLLDAYVALPEGGGIVLRSAGLPDGAPARASRAHELVAPLETIADLRTGDVIARVGTPHLAERARAALGAATVLAATPQLRGTLDAWGDPPGALAIMRSFKERFDPRGTLAPGRFVGGI